MNRRALFILLLSLFGGVILFCHSAVSGVVSEITYPFSRIAAWVSDQIGVRLNAAWRGFCDGVERTDADTEIERLRVLLNATEAIHRENAELRAALDWLPQAGLNAVVAPVWAHGGGIGVWPRLKLGVGSDKGVAEGDAVVVPEGLVGRVAEGVTAHTCEVILLSDPMCFIAAEIPGVAKGIIQGMLGKDYTEHPEGDPLYLPNPLRLRYIDMHAQLQPRQQVLTEGSGELFPRGIVIGSVIRITEPEENAGLMQEAEIAPAVDPTLLRVVFILHRKDRTP